jgi:hypothetical protein
MKKCTKCHETKEFTEFGKHKHTRDSLNSHCKACIKATSKQWIKNNKEKAYSFTENWRQNNSQRQKDSTKQWHLAKSGVYAIYENGECLYVGESSRLYGRISKHKTLIKNPNLDLSQRHLYESLQNHPLYVIGIVEETPNHKEQETFWINKLKPKYNGKKVQ